jgi:hypothetical protein
MSSRADSALPRAARRGFVLGELFVAIFLLALAISSVTALMYSVTRHPRGRAEAECSDKSSASSSKCVAPAKKSSVAKPAAAKTVSANNLLVSGCATRSGARVQACNDSVLKSRSAEATTIRSRTDSASLQLLPKKPKRAPRPDLGFIR